MPHLSTARYPLMSKGRDKKKKKMKMKMKKKRRVFFFFFNKKILFKEKKKILGLPQKRRLFGGRWWMPRLMPSKAVDDPYPIGRNLESLGETFSNLRMC